MSEQETATHTNGDPHLSKLGLVKDSDSRFCENEKYESKGTILGSIPNRR